jgi:2-(1,2-epoxy-1,2-dihydrophenyl)acetyl-CoA isomerase
MTMTTVHETASPVLYEQRDAVAVITMNRPERHNVLDMATSKALIAAVARVADGVATGAVRCVLLRGTGRSFCAGGDIKGFAQAADDLGSTLDRMIPPVNEAILTLVRLPVPVVSALNGSIGGAGIGLGLCADIVLAAESMVLRSGYCAIGLSPDIGSSWFLVRAAGSQRAKRILFCNDKFSARQCEDWGLVSEVVADEKLDARALQLAQELAMSATRAIARTKSLTDGAACRALEEQLRFEHQAMLECGRDAESAEGIAAFMGKRTPRFS